LFVGIEAGEGELEVYDANVSAVGFASAALFVAGVFGFAGSSVAELEAVECPLFESHDGHNLV